MQIKLKVVSGIKRSLIPQIQLLSCAEVTNKEFDVVGWCRYKANAKLTYDLIILSNHNGELRKMVKFFEIEEREKGLTLVNKYPRISNLTFEPSCEEEYKDLLTRCWKIYNDAKEKGQFFV